VTSATAIFWRVNSTPTEAALYKQWIANDRQLRNLTTQMRDIATKATTLALKDADRT